MSARSVDLTALRAPPAAGAELQSPAANGTASLTSNRGNHASGEKEADGEKEKPPDKAGRQKLPKAKSPGDATSNQQGEKLSNAELKKRAKAEKAAKRAQAKEARPEAAVLPDLSGPRKVDTPPEISRKNSAGGGPGIPAAKGAHKQNASIQKNMPLRPAAQPQAAIPTAQPEKENKNVALFGHLYSQPRRTTIAAAGKDVHPAVLALGLQMSNYVICGSNARCVAMLLVFKRVCTTAIISSGSVLI